MIVYIYANHTAVVKPSQRGGELVMDAIYDLLLLEWFS